MMPEQMGQMMNQVPRQMMMMQRTSVPNSMQQVSAGQPLPPVLRTSKGISPSHSVSYASPGQAGVPGASPMRRPSGSSAAIPAADRPITPRTLGSSQGPLTSPSPKPSNKGSTSSGKRNIQGGWSYFIGLKGGGKPIRGGWGYLVGMKGSKSTGKH